MMARNDALRRAIAQMRENVIGNDAGISYVEQHIESLEYLLGQTTSALTDALENNRRLTEKLNAAEEVIKTAREWKASAIAADRRAVEAEKKAKEAEAAAEYAREQRDIHRDDYYALNEIADIIHRTFGK